MTFDRNIPMPEQVQMRRRTQNDLTNVVDLLLDRLKQWGDLLDDPNTPPETVSKLAAALDKRTKVLETLQGVANPTEVLRAEVEGMNRDLRRLFAS